MSGFQPKLTENYGSILTEKEFHQLYELIGLLSTFHVVYQPPADTLLTLYRQFGLKTGDAKIAAFCEQENIEIFVSDNRHFLQKLPKRSFEVIDSMTFCQKFSLNGILDGFVKSRIWLSRRSK